MQIQKFYPDDPRGKSLQSHPFFHHTSALRPHMSLSCPCGILDTNDTNLAAHVLSPAVTGGQSGHGHFGQNRFSGNEHRNFNVTACLAPCDACATDRLYDGSRCQPKIRPTCFHPCRLHVSDGPHHVLVLFTCQLGNFERRHGLL